MTLWCFYLADSTFLLPVWLLFSPGRRRFPAALPVRSLAATKGKLSDTDPAKTIARPGPGCTSHACKNRRRASGLPAAAQQCSSVSAWRWRGAGRLLRQPPDAFGSEKKNHRSPGAMSLPAPEFFPSPSSAADAREPPRRPRLAP